METITLREFRETGTKYKKLRTRLDKRIKNGSFYQLTKRKQRNLVYRVRKLYEKLLRLKNLLKLATAGATMSLMLTTGQADAQNFQKKLPFKKEFKAADAGIKSYESDLFVQMTGSNNPFSGTNPFEGNIIKNAGYANFVDIDNDGDLDVFSFDYNYTSGLFSVIYYKNIGDNNNVILKQQYGPDNPGDEAVFGNQPYISFVDIDNDGDFDVFIGDQNNNKILYFKNIGSPENPYFVPKTGTDNPLDGVDPQGMNRLNFADIDNDGDLDVFIGKYNNYPYLYRNTGDAENPAFTPEDASGFFDATFGSTLESILLRDIDGDGDFDALINGDSYFENQGSNTAPDFVEITGNSNPFSNINKLNSNLPDLIDLDSDSDLDLIFGWYNKIEYYKNTGNASSAIFENTSGGIDSSAYYTMPEFVDIDNDGDFDMFTGVYTAGVIKYAYYKNTGTSETPVFEKQAWTDNPLNADTALTPIPVLKFADIDNDGDFDLFTAGYGSYSDLRYFKNTGTADAPVFEEQTGSNNPFDGISNVLDLDFVDIDNDGDFDCFFGLTSGMAFFRNTGTPDAPVFTNEASPVTIPDTWYYLFPEFADIDNDGDFDLIAGGVDYDLYQWGVLYAENKGTADTPDFKAQYGNANPLNLTFYVPGIAFADIDNDGDQDCFIGTLGGSIYYFKNKTVSAGIENAATDNSLFVYPNPVSNEMRIDLSSFGSEDVNISVFDITGKIVSSYILKDKNTINVSNLKSGVYFIKARDSKHSETAKFIKK